MLTLSSRGCILGLFRPLPPPFNHHAYSHTCRESCHTFNTAVDSFLTLFSVVEDTISGCKKIVPNSNLVWERFNSLPPFGINYYPWQNASVIFLINFIWINAYSRKLATHLPLWMSVNFSWLSFKSSNFNQIFFSFALSNYLTTLFFSLNDATNTESLK